MSLTSRLTNVDSGTVVGLVTAAGVYLIYQNALPNVTDVRSAMPNNTDVETARKHSAIVSAAIIGGVFLIARDVNSYVISGAALVGIDLMYKHANAVHPATGKVDTSTDGQSISNVYPLPEYSAETAS